MKSNDTYERITQTIVEQLENGVKPWISPWNGAPNMKLPLRSNGQTYQGINVLALWIASLTFGYDQPMWMTFKQAQELGGQVRKGEKSTLVVKYGTFTPKDEMPVDNEERQIPYLKGYSVFNIRQIDGLPEHLFIQPDLPDNEIEPHVIADNFIANTGAIIEFGGTQAYYRPSSDTITMPDRKRFVDQTHLYSTLLHELGHWTAAKSRLDRDLTGRFGSEAYAMDELVAELTSAFVCSDLQVPINPEENTATYISTWLEVLKNDPKAIFTAASKAQAAANYLHGLQPSELDKAA